jgi:hypothetical protein
VFSTTSTSYHGHPEPLACPEDRTRKSLALYYYTKTRPTEQGSTAHNTLFQARPGEELPEPADAPPPPRPAERAKAAIRMITPPIVFAARRRWRARNS